jgi:ATP-binding cassette, subfamily A (ABC1), member 3
VALALDEDVKDPLDIDVGGPSLYFMIADVAIFWCVIALFENGIINRWIQRYNLIRRRQQNQLVNSIMPLPEDDDVVEEERRIEAADPANCTIRLVKARKIYGGKTMAVDKVSFGLEYGECFALLGVSGAGKTTTFKLLTGEEKQTEGIVQVNGFDINTRAGFESARKLIGYCPQFDAIFDGLTVREHLEFYAKVKGVVQRFR